MHTCILRASFCLHFFFLKCECAGIATATQVGKLGVEVTHPKHGLGRTGAAVSTRWAVIFENGESHTYTKPQMTEKFGITSEITLGMSVMHHMRGAGIVGAVDDKETYDLERFLASCKKRRTKSVVLRQKIRFVAFTPSVLGQCQQWCMYCVSECVCAEASEHSVMSQYHCSTFYLSPPVQRAVGCLIVLNFMFNLISAQYPTLTEGTCKDPDVNLSLLCRSAQTNKEPLRNASRPVHFEALDFRSCKQFCACG